MQFTKNWWIIALVCSVFIGGSLLLLIGINLPVIESLQAGKDFPVGWSWASLIIINIMILMIGIGGIWVPFVEIFTNYSEDGISRPSFSFNQKMIKWSEITSAKVAGISPKNISTIKLVRGAQCIKINLFYYRDPERLMQYISNYLSGSLDR